MDRRVETGESEAGGVMGHVGRSNKALQRTTRPSYTGVGHNFEWAVTRSKFVNPVEPKVEKPATDLKLPEY